MLILTLLSVGTLILLGSACNVASHADDEADRLLLQLQGESEGLYREAAQPDAPVRQPITLSASMS